MTGTRRPTSTQPRYRSPTAVSAVAEDQIACAIQPLRRRQGSRAPAPIHSRTEACEWGGEAPPGKLVYPLRTLEPGFWPLVAPYRPATMRRLAGLLSESRRGDSNPGPLHYE
jgi:hypothetical protein